jgi:hypothetical protein
MPSMRLHPLNARPRVSPATPPTPPVGAVPAAQPSAAPPVAASPATERDAAAEDNARAGGFHESSYELQHGLHISESAWPDDVTVPGSLGDR